MADREKVIKGLECCTGNCGYMTDCPYSYDCHGADPNGVSRQLLTDALALLKEQEAVKPIVEQYDLPLTLTSVRKKKKYYCGICKEEITGNNVYCHKCGRKVQWNESVD